MKWVFCGGMLRSGSTLQYNIAAEIVERLRLGRRERWIDDHEDYFRNVQQEQVIVFKSHELTQAIQNLFENQGARALVSYRDIRDVVASWQAKSGKILDQDLALSFSDNAIQMFCKWEKMEERGVYLSKYEYFISDLIREIKAIASFLDFEIDANLVNVVNNIVSTDSMVDLLSRSTASDLTTSGEFTWNTKTLVHLDHLNGGRVGRYKTELSDEVKSRLTDRHQGWLLKHGYEL